MHQYEPVGATNILYISYGIAMVMRRSRVKAVSPWHGLGIASAPCICEHGRQRSVEAHLAISSSRAIATAGCGGAASAYISRSVLQQAVAKGSSSNGAFLLSSDACTKHRMHS